MLVTNKISSPDQLLNRIQDTGYLHLPYPQSKDAASILAEFGKTIYTAEIRENPDSTRLLASHQKIELHTDHFAAKYIAWFCRSQSARGGESILLYTYPILQSFSKEVLMLLGQVKVNAHHVFYNDTPNLPLIKFIDKKPAVYFSPWMVNPPGCIKHQKALQKFTDSIQSQPRRKILLHEGDLLIIDNHRMLHGREAFPQGSDRWLARYWLCEKA